MRGSASPWLPGPPGCPWTGLSPPGLVSDGLVSDGLVSDGLVSSRTGLSSSPPGLVTGGLVSTALLPDWSQGLSSRNGLRRTCLRRTGLPDWSLTDWFQTDWCSGCVSSAWFVRQRTVWAGKQQVRPWCFRPIREEKVKSRNQLCPWWVLICGFQKPITADGRELFVPFSEVSPKECV